MVDHCDPAGRRAHPGETGYGNWASTSSGAGEPVAAATAAGSNRRSASAVSRAWIVARNSRRAAHRAERVEAALQEGLQRAHAGGARRAAHRLQAGAQHEAARVAIERLAHAHHQLDLARPRGAARRWPARRARSSRATAPRRRGGMAIAVSSRSDNACTAASDSTVPTVSAGNSRTSAGTMRLNCASRCVKSCGPYSSSRKKLAARP